MGKYSVPEEIRKLRPRGTTVKKVKGHYYVYEYSSTSTKQEMSDGSFEWKTVNKMGPCIGQITLEDGFVRNGRELTETDLSVFEYGDYFLIRECAAETRRLLAEKFSEEEANQIFSVASIFLAEGFQDMGRLPDVFSESVLSQWYPDVRMGSDALKTLYANLGKHGKKPDKFRQNLINNSSKKVAVFRHANARPAESGDLSAYGYKAEKSDNEQMNRMTAYDTETQLPLYNEMLIGSDPDEAAAEGMFSWFHFSDTLFLIGAEFSTEKDKALFSENGNTYIVPMLPGQEDYEAIYEAVEFDEQKTFTYEKDGYSSLIRYETYEIEGNPVSYHVFLDTKRQSAERETYIRRMKAGVKGYTEEGLADSENDFGLIFLETNDLRKTAQEVFTDYQSRRDLETFFRSVDSNSELNALDQQDSRNMPGLSFLLQISGMIFSELRKVLREQAVSVKDAMFLLSGLKLVKDRNRYVVRNENKERRQLCEKINLNPANHGVQSSTT
ncbi:MAG: hypothetical protein IJ088_09250 [Clostridia bacterium]|nr:hypothetical protein [Clostridia bacterium]